MKNKKLCHFVVTYKLCSKEDQTFWMASQPAHRSCCIYEHTYTLGFLTSHGNRRRTVMCVFPHHSHRLYGGGGWFTIMNSGDSLLMSTAIDIPAAIISIVKKANILKTKRYTYAHLYISRPLFLYLSLVSNWIRSLLLVGL